MAKSSRPEYLPEAFWDAAAGRVRSQAAPFVDEDGKAVRIDQLWKSYDESRRELNRIKEATKPPREYTLNVPDDVPVPAWLQGGGPLEEAVLAAAGEAKIPQAALDAIVGGYLKGAGAAMEAEMAALRAQSPSEEAHARRIAEISGRVKAVSGDDEAMRATLHAWASSALGVQLLEQALDGRLAEKARRYVAVPGADPQAPGGNGFDREAEAKRLMRTDEYRRGDKAVHAKVQRIFEELYPGEQQTAALNPGWVRD